MPQQQQQNGGGWAQNAFQQQQPTAGNDRERVTLCFNDDISEVLNIMQQQQQVMVKQPGERQEDEEEEKKVVEKEEKMKSGRVLTVFPPHLPLANLRSILHTSVVCTITVSTVINMNRCARSAQGMLCSLYIRLSPPLTTSDTLVTGLVCISRSIMAIFRRVTGRLVKGELTLAQAASDAGKFYSTRSYRNLLAMSPASCHCFCGRHDDKATFGGVGRQP